MATFEQLMRANARIRTTDIKGKEYAEVNQRIKAFRMVYPDGGIMTQLLSNDNGIAVFHATVSDNDGHILGEGTAYEKENSSFINKTSYIENCETSAVGRALGMAGFGIDTSVASYEEVANAMEQQKKEEKISQEEADVLEALISAVKANDPVEERIKKICSAYGVKNLNELTASQYAKLVKQLDR